MSGVPALAPPIARPAAVAARVVAWGAWVLMLALVIGSVLVWLVDGMKPLPISFARGAIGVGSVAACAFVFTSLGAVLGSRLVRNPIGWLLLPIGLLFAFLTPVNLVIQRAFEVAQPFPRATLVVAWAMSSVMTPIIVASSLTICLVFPDGRFLSRRWSTGVALALVGAGLLAVASAVEPTGLIWYPTVPNPAALPVRYETVAVGVRLLSLVVLIGAGAVALAAVLARYRCASPRVQVQLHWILGGVATMTAGLLPFLVARYALQVSDQIGELLIGVAAVAICAFPVSVALAMARQHLFELDQVISHTLVYVPLMGILAGVYTASVTLFQRIFLSLTNNTSDAAVVMSVLVLASVFAPVRSALEARVHRSFQPAERDRGRPDLGEPMPVSPGETAGARAPATARPAVAGPIADGDIAAQIASLEASLEALRQRDAERSRPRPADP